MIRFLLISLFVSTALSGAAETVVPLRTIRANAIIEAHDLGLQAGVVEGAFEDARNVVGQEAKVALYAGRPIRFDDIGAPAIVDRNQIVALFFTQGGLRISTEGRALSRGGVGDRIRVMNLESRATLFGLIQLDGSIEIQR
jgi:flagella basal body P-ring formation protein FlgA